MNPEEYIIAANDLFEADKNNKYELVKILDGYRWFVKLLAQILTYEKPIHPPFNINRFFGAYDLLQCSGSGFFVAYQEGAEECARALGGV